MSKKAETIKKEVILITTKQTVSFLKYERFDTTKEPDISVNIEYFDECRFFKGTHSIKKETWTYYCKNDNYYCAFNYCLIIDVSQKQKALEDFFKVIRTKYESDISTHKESIKKLQKGIDKFNKIENETNI
jgi:hypothetical protein